jgi:hypothetical protein
MKAIKLHGVEMSCDGETDWHTDLVNRLYSNPQSTEEGSWLCAWGVSKELATVFALLTMDEMIPEFLNQPPVVSADLATLYADEGALAINTGTLGDPDGDVLVVTASAGTIVDIGDGTWSWSYPTTDGPVESQVITVTVDDGNGETASVSFDMVVLNVPPEIVHINLPVDPIALAEPVVVSLDYTDPAGSNDGPFYCLFAFSDGSSETVESSILSASASHTFADAGVYSVTILVTDKDGGSVEGSITQFIVIYDPSVGFVTGGGWIDSPEGAYVADPSLTGKANFGFVSRYKKGQAIPDGNTEFQFHAGNLNFHSSNYEWLVIASAKAMFKGDGTINGAGAYGFLLSAIDEKLTSSTDVDLFRLKIWDMDNNDALVYDNKVGETDPVADPTTEIGGGSITIHNKSTKKAVMVNADEEFSLTNYPNPFKTFTTIRFNLEEESDVLLRVFDVFGKEVRMLLHGSFEQGLVNIRFEAEGLQPGQYFYTIETKSHVLTRTMVILE